MKRGNTMQKRTWKRNISNIRKEVMVTLLVDKEERVEYCKESYYYYGRLSRIELIKTIDEDYDKYVIISISHF